MRKRATLFSLVIMVIACAGEPQDDLLPKGESGAGEVLDAFFEICVRSNHGNGPALFQRVRASGYERVFEVRRQEKYEAQAKSFWGNREGVCPIRVTMVDSLSIFGCYFSASWPCDARGPNEFGRQIGARLQEMNGVSRNEAVSEELNKHFRDERFYIFDVEGARIQDGRIVLSYRVNGSRVSLGSGIEPNHDFTNVLTRAEALQKLKEDMEQ